MSRLLRRGLRRRAAVAYLVLAALLSWLPFAPRAGASPSKPIVVVVAIPGLQWSDVGSMPVLERFVAHSSVGELSVKTAGGVTRCAAGILAVGAGNRTSDSLGNCPIVTPWPVLQRDNINSKYQTTIGLLGTSLQQAGVATVALGPLARPMLATEGGVLPQELSTVARAVAVAEAAPRGAVIVTLDAGMYYLTPAADRAAKARQVDTRLAATLAGLPRGATVIVAGISDIATGKANLHLFAIAGPGWGQTELRSSAAGRAPYVQLIDIAPTILSTLGIPIPPAVVGRPMQQSGTTVPSISALADDNRHAYDQRTLGQRTFLALGIAAIVLMLWALLPISSARRSARWLGRVLAPAPMLAFVGNAFPWWRWGQPVYAVIVVGSAVAVAVVATIAARRSAVYAAIVPLAATLIALVMDQLTGGHLQLSAPLGDNPIVAGRFSGVGNLDFAAIATAALLLAGLVGGKVGGRRGALVAAVIAAAAVIVDGAPQLGDDIGGVFALLPGAIVVVAVLFQSRITWRRALLAIGATAIVAVTVALADYSRPATKQSHVGRFVGQVLHGGAGPEVHRKLDAALSTFGWTVGTFVVGVAIAAGFVAHRRIRAALRETPGLTAGAVAAAVTAVLGVALNDSGIPIGAMAVMVGVSAIYGAVGGRPSPVARGRAPLPAASAEGGGGRDPLQA